MIDKLNFVRVATLKRVLLLIFMVTPNFVQASTIDNSRWMTHLYYSSDFSQRQLKDITIPGSHDAAAYKVDAIFKKAFISNWVVTQDENIKEQLNGGMRYFDLRIIKDGGTYWIHHGGHKTVKLSEVVNHVQEYMQSVRSDRELIILNFSHFTGVKGSNKESVLKSQVVDKLSEFVVKSEHVTSKIGSSILATPYQDILGDGQSNPIQSRVMVIVDEATLNSTTPVGIFSRTEFPQKSVWKSPGENKVSDLITREQNGLNDDANFSSSAFYKTQWVLTPRWNDLGGVKRLAAFTDGANANLVKFFDDYYGFPCTTGARKNRANIIFTDFNQYANYPALQVAYKMNLAENQTCFESHRRRLEESGGQTTEAINIGNAVNGEWLRSGGTSEVHEGNPHYYVSLTKEGVLVVDLVSNINTYLLVLDELGEVIAFNDDRYDSSTNSQLALELAAGNYTIVAGTQEVGMIGTFTLSTELHSLSGGPSSYNFTIMHENINQTIGLIDFGDVAVGQSSEVTVTFDNGELVDVLDNCATYPPSSGSGFVITSQTCGDWTGDRIPNPYDTHLQPNRGSSCEVTLKYRPTVQGYQSNRFQLYCNDSSYNGNSRPSFLVDLRANVN